MNIKIPYKSRSHIQSIKIIVIHTSKNTNK